MQSVFRFFILALFITFLFQSCSDIFGKDTETLTCDDFTEDVKLYHEEGREVDYIIDCLVEVDDIDITIYENAVLEFTEGSGLIINEDARLSIVSLIEEEPITLRGQQSEKGFWKGIYLNSNHTIDRISNVIISDAGDPNDDRFLGGITVKTNGGVNGSTIKNMLGYGIYVHDNAVIGGGLVGLDFYNCNQHPISVPIPVIHEFYNPIPPQGDLYGRISSEDCNPNKIEVRAGSTPELKEMNGAFVGVGVPYQIKGDIVITSSRRLDLYPNAELEMAKDSRIYVYGSFTSKGEPGSPALVYGAEDQQGYWGGIYIEKPEGFHNQIEYLHILNGGGGDFENANLTFRSGNFTVENCKISKSGSCGIRYFSDDVILNESGNTFADNAGGAICEN